MYINNHKEVLLMKDSELDNLEELIPLLAKGAVQKYEPLKERKPNLFKEKIEIFEDFDSGDEDIIKLFEGLNSE